MVSEYDDVKCKLNNILKLHREINIVTYLLSKMRFLLLLDMKKIIQTGTREGTNTQFLTEGAADLRSRMRSSLRPINELIFKER